MTQCANFLVDVIPENETLKLFLALLKSCPGLLKLYLQTSVESIPAVTYRPSEQFQKMAAAVAANPLSNEGGSSSNTADYYKPCWMFPTRDQTGFPAFSQLKNKSNANSSDQSRLDPIQVQKVNNGKTFLLLLLYCYQL